MKQNIHAQVFEELVPSILPAGGGGGSYNITSSRSFVTLDQYFSYHLFMSLFSFNLYGTFNCIHVVQGDPAHQTADQAKGAG